MSSPPVLPVHADRFPDLRLRFVATLTLAYWALLAWQHLHDGVPAHSFAARDDMPAISNWWGALTIPVFSWALTGLIQGSLSAFGTDRSAADASLRVSAVAFVAALIYGAAMATLFRFDRESSVLATLFFALPVIGAVVPIFRPEFVLGFVLGMTYTFGPVLPLVVAFGVALASGLVHVLLRPLLLRLARVAR